MLGKLVSDSCIYEACMNPTLNGISVVRHFERGNVIEMGDFDFYTRLSHVYPFMVISYHYQSHSNKFTQLKVVKDGINILTCTSVGRDPSPL